MNNDSIIEFGVYLKNDFDEFKKMVIALYKEDAYGEKITIHNIKKTISELSANSNKGDIYIFKSTTKIVGYAIIIYYWSNEYGKKALNLITNIAFNHLKLNRLEAHIAIENISSIHLFKTCGFKHEGKLAQYLNFNGSTRPSISGCMARTP